MLGLLDVHLGSLFPENYEPKEAFSVHCAIPRDGQ